jgi:hypothetical protein
MTNSTAILYTCDRISTVSTRHKDFAESLAKRRKLHGHAAQVYNHAFSDLSDDVFC